MQPHDVARSDKSRLDEGTVKLVGFASRDGDVERTEGATALHLDVPKRPQLGECVPVVYVSGGFRLGKGQEGTVPPRRPGIRSVAS